LVAPGEQASEGKRPHVDKAVIAVVRAWAQAKNLDDAAKALAHGRRDLDAVLHAQLQTEIAEITAHTLIEVMTLEEGVVEGETVELNGIPLLPKQVERISAWKNDQVATAEALSVEIERWHTLVIAGMEVVCAEQASGEIKGSMHPAKAAADRVAQARALLGDSGETFENRPALGTSARAGLSGMLAARSFKGTKKKK